MQVMSNEQVINLLRENQNGTKITFTKSDGSIREMLCTLAESKIPTDKLPKTKSEEGSSTIGSAVRVFDLDKQEWRSFRFDSVITIGA